MFDHIGGKIKVLAKVMTLLGIIASIVVGIVLLSEDLLGAGFGVMLGGCFISWIGSFFTYGFGELIEKTTEIAQNTAPSAKAPVREKMTEIAPNTAPLVETPVKETTLQAERVLDTSAETSNGKSAIISKEENLWQCPECERVHNLATLECQCGYKLGL